MSTALGPDTPEVLLRRPGAPAGAAVPRARRFLALLAVHGDEPCGVAAANRLLEDWGVSGHTLYSVPVTGRSPVLRRLAGRALADRGSAERGSADRGLRGLAARGSR